MEQPKDEYLQTRKSLIDRLKDWGDKASWQDFFDTYWRLIYSIARKAELTEAEAQDVVQDTMVTVAKWMPKFQYDPAVGKFKSWLATITRCRIVDQLRKRGPFLPLQPAGNDSTKAPDLVDRATQQFDKLWDAEWSQNLLETAKARVRRKANPDQYQLYHFYVSKDWPADKVAAQFGVSLNQVYLAKNRIGEMIKEEIKLLDKDML